MADKKDDIVARAKKFYQRCISNEASQRSEELDDIKFSGLLEQWPENIKRIREADPQGARPCLVVDKVNQYKNQIINNMRQMRPSIKARPVDDSGDIEVAEVYQGIIRHIEDASKADIAYDWAGEGAVTSGLGYFQITNEYVDDSFQQEIRIARIRNRFSCYADPNSKEPDGSDAQEFLITEKVNRKIFESKYPNVELSEWNSSTGDGDWFDEDSIRIAEYFYIEKTKATICLLEDGNSMYKDEYEEGNAKSGNVDDPESNEAAESDSMEGYEAEQKPRIIKERSTFKITVKWCKLTGSEILEEAIIPGKYIPVIPVIGIETDVDGKRYLRGVVRGVKDAQRMYNYNRSMMVESMNLSVKAPFIGFTGQFKTSGDKWASANRVNYAYLEADPVTVNGNLAPLPQRQSFAGVPTGLLQDIETSEHDIQAALGMYQSSIGQDGNAKSGRAMNAQAKQGDMATFMFPDNQSKSIRHAGRVLLGMIPVIYDTAQVVRILGNDGTVNYASIDPDQKEAVTKQQQPDGSIKKIYNLGVGKYDVTISVGASFATKRQEGADFITQLVQTSPDLMPIVGDLLFKSMDMPYSEEIAERMKKMMPPQLQDDPNDDSSPEVQQIKQQAGQQMQQLTQQLDQAHQAMQGADQEAKGLMQQVQQAQMKLAQSSLASQQKDFEHAKQLFEIEQNAQKAIDAAIGQGKQADIDKDKYLAGLDYVKTIEVAELSHQTTLTANQQGAAQAAAKQEPIPQEPVAPVINIHMPSSKRTITKNVDGSFTSEDV